MHNLHNFLNRLRVGYKCRSAFITLYFSAENIKFLHFFYKKCWIKHYLIQGKQIIVYLRYINNKPLFNKISLISTPGFRQYLSLKGLTYYKRNMGRGALVLLYTSYGLLTLKEAKNLKIGGEISFILYE